MKLFLISDFQLLMEIQKTDKKLTENEILSYSEMLTHNNSELRKNLTLVRIFSEIFECTSFRKKMSKT